MIQLIQSYEKFQKVEKKINIDTFEDEEFLNSGSGSFFEGKKSKANSSKRQSLDSILQIKASQIYSFVTGIIGEITKQDLEDKLLEIESCEQPARLGFFLLSVVEFLEVASSHFSGFS